MEIYTKDQHQGKDQATGKLFLIMKYTILYASGANAPVTNAPTATVSVATALPDPSVILTRVQPDSATARTQMSAKYSKSQDIAQFNMGNLVSLDIPRIDRHATNVHRLCCKLILKARPDRQQLLTVHGILNSYYPTRELQHLPLNFTHLDLDQLHPLSVYDANRLSLREAASLTMLTQPETTCKSQTCHYSYLRLSREYTIKSGSSPSSSESSKEDTIHVSGPPA